MFGQADLTIRQFERNDVVLDGEFEVDVVHQGQVAFSRRNADMIDSRTLKVSLSDIGAGGMGFQAPIFLPRMLSGVLRVFDLPESGSAPEARPTRRIAFEHAVRIRRCELTSRVPSYFVGSSFENADDRLEAELDALVDRIASSMRRRLKPVDGDVAMEQEHDRA